METVTASAYLVVKATRQFGRTDPETGLRPVQEARIVSSRQSRPTQLGRDEILIKVVVQLPVGAFDPIAPQALIIVPEDLVLDRHQIEIEAQGDAQEEAVDG